MGGFVVSSIDRQKDDYKTERGIEAFLEKNEYVSLQRLVFHGSSLILAKNL